MAATWAWFAAGLTPGLADVVELADTGVGDTTGAVRTNWPILPSSVTQMLPSGPAVIPPDVGIGISVITRLEVIRPIPAPELLSAK